MENSIRLPNEERRELEKLMRARGERGAAELLGVHPRTLVRAIAGVGIQRVTATALRARLLEQPRPTV